VAVCTVHRFLVTLLKVSAELLPIMLQYNLIFFSGRSQPVHSHFCSSNESVVQNLFTSQYNVDFKGTETLGNQILNLLPHIYMISFHCRFPK
jgi:hypothetical protein